MNKKSLIAAVAAATLGASAFAGMVQNGEGGLITAAPSHEVTHTSQYTRAEVAAQARYQTRDAIAASGQVDPAAARDNGMSTVSRADVRAQATQSIPLNPDTLVASGMQQPSPYR